MSVPILEVGRTGRLDLRFAERGGATVMAHAFCEVPSKVTRLHSPPSSDLAHVMLMHCTAGLFGGDCVDTTIRVERGARVVLTQQAATKVHPSRDRDAVQTTRVSVAAGAELHLDFDPLILFAGSRLDQRMTIELEPGARFSYWESFMAGRVGSGEAWRFARFQSETCLLVDGRTLLLDRFDLRPALEPPCAWSAGVCGYIATGLSVDDDTERMVEALHRLMPDAGIDSPAPGLTIVRAPTASGVAHHRHQDVFARAVRGDLHI